MNSRLVRGPEDTLDVSQAEKFFKEQIYDLMQGTKAKREEYEFFETGMWIAPRLWELFVAILIGQKKAKAAYGHDLEASEVKSMRVSGSGDTKAILSGVIKTKPKSGSSWEYQYHRNAGENKLSAEVRIDHVLIRYTADLSVVEVFSVCGFNLLSIFNSWSGGLKANYKGTGKQRYRKSISVKIVSDPEMATRLLEIKAGKVTFHSKAKLGKLFPSAYVTPPLPAPPQQGPSAVPAEPPASSPAK